MAHYQTEPERSLELIDSALFVGNITPARAVYLRGCIYLLDDIKRKDLPLMIEPVLEDPQTRARDFLLLKELLHNYYVQAEVLPERSRLAQELASIYHEKGDLADELRMRVDEADVLISLGQPEEGVPMLNEAIEGLSAIKTRDALDGFLDAHKALVRYYQEGNKPTEMLASASAMLNAINDYEKHPETYGDSPSDRRDQFIDFKKAAAFSYLALAHAMKGNMAEARHYAQEFETTSSSKVLSRRRVIASAYLAMGEYDKMQKDLDAFCESWGADTLHANYAEILKMRSEYARLRGQYRESLQYLHRHNQLRKALQSQKARTDAAQYATLYKVQEEALARKDAEKKVARQRAILTIAGVGLLALLALFVFETYRRREMKKKNKVLSEQIAQTLMYKERAAEILAASEEARRHSLESLDASELYDFLSEAIVQERMFLDPRFSRQVLMDKYGISKERVGAAFSSAGTSLPAFVADCRLDLACKLLVDTPDTNIEDIAQASGFTSRRSFARTFAQKFALSPSEYRESRNRT